MLGREALVRIAAMIAALGRPQSLLRAETTGPNRRQPAATWSGCLLRADGSKPLRDEAATYVKESAQARRAAAPRRPRVDL